jgi:hypothetical protein
MGLYEQRKMCREVSRLRRGSARQRRGEVCGDAVRLTGGSANAVLWRCVVLAHWGPAARNVKPSPQLPGQRPGEGGGEAAG